MKFFDISSLEDATAHGLKSGTFRPSIQPRLHRHGEIELNYLEQGSMTYFFGSERVIMQAGQFAIFWALIPHQVIQAEEQAILHWFTLPFAYFLQRQLPDILTQPLICGKFVLGSRDDDRGMTLAFVQNWQKDLERSRASLESEAMERRQVVLLEMEVYLRRLALHMAEEKTLPVVAGAEEAAHLHELNKVEQMACFIAQHYTEPLPAKEIADSVHLHPSYAMTIFVKHFGVSMLDYITQYRIAHAQRLLMTTDENASEIALTAGFGSVSRFYATFKSLCGCSPGTYRIRYNQSWREQAGAVSARPDKLAKRRFKLSGQLSQSPE